MVVWFGIVVLENLMNIEMLNNVDNRCLKIKLYF